MSNEPGLSDGHRRASPWPLFVALGLAFSELGVFLGIFPVAVAGLVLLGSSVAAILRESGYVTRPWAVLAGLGAVFSVLGVAVVATQVAPASLAVRDTIGDPNGVVGRGLAVLVAGVVLLAAGTTGTLVGPAGN